MTELEKAARQALEALEGMTKDLGRFPEDVAAITALRQALENHEAAYQRGYLDGMAKPCINCADRKLQAMKQPKQEPVAWATMPEADDWCFVSGSKDPNKKLEGVWVPLYTEPPQRKPLTRDQALKIVAANPDAMTAIRMTEAAHGIKE